MVWFGKTFNTKGFYGNNETRNTIVVERTLDPEGLGDDNRDEDTGTNLSIGGPTMKAGEQKET